MKQSTMFAHEDLPLFSGTAKRVKADPFEPKSVHRRETFLCQICGLVACDCDWGDARKLREV